MTDFSVEGTYSWILGFWRSPEAERNLAARKFVDNSDRKFEISSVEKTKTVAPTAPAVPSESLSLQRPYRQSPAANLALKYNPPVLEQGTKLNFFA